jgi:membrane-bound lytic murein transglycosylase D
MNRELDERRDIYKSTRAAARYFKDMYAMFNSWELALAGYNAGEFGIQRRLKRHELTRYEELSRRKLIPQETINYVPKVLAAMHVVENAKRYGLTVDQGTSDLWTSTTLKKVRGGQSLSSLARELGVSTVVLNRLNPELLRGRTPSSGSYKLRVPKEINDQWAERFIASYPKAIQNTVRVTQSGRRPSSRNARVTHTKRPLTYTVKNGETLKQVAKWFDVSLSKLQKVNRLKTKRMIQAGQRLVLPNTRKGIYTVRKGDYLLKIADKFNLNKTAIMKLNNLAHGRIRPGQKLVVNVN